VSGWAHRRTVNDGTVVAVTAAPTVLCEAEVNSLVSASGVIVNLDSTDDLTVRWQTSWAADFSSPAELVALNGTQFLEPLGPGEARHFQFDTRDLRYFRALGTMTGDGGNVKIFFQLVAGLPVR
jgi:hypothetical protein